MSIIFRFSSSLFSQRKTHPLRVAIAQSLVNEPSILLADEPVGNLDSKTSVEIMGILQRLNRELGITIVMIPHELDIASLASRNIYFKDGSVVH